MQVIPTMTVVSGYAQHLASVRVTHVRITGYSCVDLDDAVVTLTAESGGAADDIPQRDCKFPIAIISDAKLSMS